MKKLLSGALTIVMFFSILTTFGLIAAKNSINSNSMGKMMDVLVEEYDIVDSFGGAAEDELEDLFEDKKFKKITSELLSDYVKYTVRITDKEPDFTEFVEYVAEETDSDYDEDEIEDLIDELESEMETERIPEDDESAGVIKAIFSGSALIVALLISVACAFGIYSLNKDSKKTVRRVGIVSIIDGALIMGLGSLLMNFAEQEAGSSDEAMMAVVEIILNNFTTIGIVCIILGIVLVVLSPKITSMLSSIKKSNQEINNLDDSVITK